MPEVRFPVPSVPIVDEKTRTVTREWRWFFHDILVRIGGLGEITGLFTSDIDDSVQAWDAQLDDIAALAVADGNFIVGDGSNWVAENGGTARASLGLVIGTDVQAQGADLDALEALGSTGIAVRTAADTWAQRTLTAAGGAFWADGDGVSGNPTIDVALQVFEVTVGQGDVASAAEKILLDAATGETWKVLDIVLSADGTDFSGGGGDRLMAITDGTSTWSIIPAATLQTLAVARWGDTGMPDPSTASHLFAASGSGTDIVAKYSGGTTDYTAGSLTLRITAYRTT